MAKREANKLNHKTLLGDIKTLQADFTADHDAQGRPLTHPDGQPRWAAPSGGARAASDGAGLYIVVTRAGNAKFVHRYRFAGKPRERWFQGEFPAVKLDAARALRDADRALLRAGKDPLAEDKKAVVAAKGVPTFAAYAKEHAAFLAPDNANGAKSWLRQMTGEGTKGVTVGALAGMPIDSIELKNVLAVIEPIWKVKPATAKELCGRIYRVLQKRRAIVCPDDIRRNPADFDLITNAIGRELELNEQHRAALSWENVPAFLAELAKRPQVSARALELVVATGCRVGEITAARWTWVNWAARTLTIPAEVMKTGQEHVIPLSLMMVRILRARMAFPHHADDLIFANGKGNEYTTKDVLVHVHALAGKGAATTHGFRSTLSDWGLEFPHRGDHEFDADLMDFVVAHKVGSKVRQAYQRATRLNARRVVMREWSRYCAGAASAKVVPFRLAA